VIPFRSVWEWHSCMFIFNPFVQTKQFLYDHFSARFQVHQTCLNVFCQTWKFSSLNHPRMEGGRERRPSSSPLQSPFPFGTPITNSDRSLLSPGRYNGHASESQVSPAGMISNVRIPTIFPILRVYGVIQIIWDRHLFGLYVFDSPPPHRCEVTFLFSPKKLFIGY